MVVVLVRMAGGSGGTAAEHLDTYPRRDGNLPLHPCCDADKPATPLRPLGAINLADVTSATTKGTDLLISTGGGRVFTLARLSPLCRTLPPDLPTSDLSMRQLAAAAAARALALSFC